MRNMFILSFNTLRMVLRKKSYLFFFVIFPILGMVFSLLNNKAAPPRTLNVGICDSDHSRISGDLIRSFQAQKSFKVRRIPETKLNGWLMTGKLDCLFIIPRGFTNWVITGVPGRITIYADKNEETAVWIRSYLNIYSQNLAAIGVAAGGNQVVFYRLYRDFQNQPPLFIQKLSDRRKDKQVFLQSIGLLILAIMFGSGLVANQIIDEKRAGTFSRVLTAPVSAKSYIAGNILTNIIVIFAQVSLVLILTTQIFRINTFISPLLLFMVLMIFGLVAISLGMVIVSVAKDRLQMNMFSYVIIVPTSMLGGCFWSVEMMPRFMQNLANFFPQKWTLEAIGRLQNGDSPDKVLMDILIILAFGVLFFILAAYGINRNKVYQVS